MDVPTIQITLTIRWDGNVWVILFEEQSNEGYRFYRETSPIEPSTPGLYPWIWEGFHELPFSRPVEDAAAANVASRQVNYKRMIRESRKQIATTAAPTRLR